jgi:hypothetical protein
MMDPTPFPTSLISDSPIDESPKSKFTTASPETREAAKTVAMSIFLLLSPKIAEEIVDTFPNIVSNTLYRSTVCCHFSSAAVLLAALMLEVRTEVISGDVTGRCAGYRIYDLCKDELAFRIMHM